MIHIKIDEFVNSRIHQVFGVSCLVFGMKYMMLYWYVRTLNTKHQTPNTKHTRKKFAFLTFYEIIKIKHKYIFLFWEGGIIL